MYSCFLVESGGSKNFPVAVFQLPKQRQGEAKLQQSSRHRSMIENALQDAIESVLFSGGFNDLLAGSIIEITKVRAAASICPLKISTGFSNITISLLLRNMDDKAEDGGKELSCQEIFRFF